MNLLIRKWKPEDVPALVKLTFQWGYETTEEKICKNLNRISETENAEVFIAEVDGVVAGRIFVREHLTLYGNSFAEIHDMVVDEEYRRKGIGKMLIERVKEWSKEKGFTVLRLRTNTKRQDANSFYPSIGFTLDKMQNVYVQKI